MNIIKDDGKLAVEARFIRRIEFRIRGKLRSNKCAEGAGKMSGRSRVYKKSRVLCKWICNKERQYANVAEFYVL